MLKLRPSQIAALLATVLVVVGFGDMPYGYYRLLRLVLCGISVYLWLGAELPFADWQKWALGATAFLYNPIIPIHLGDKDLWIVANVVTLALFWAVSPLTKHRAAKNSASDPVIHRIVQCAECGQKLAAPPDGRLRLRRPKCRAEFQL